MQKHVRNLDTNMIIETPYKTNDTVTIKTSAGEEVVARCVDDKDGYITITKPLAVMATQQGAGLGPWCFTADPTANLTLNKQCIMFINKTESQMASQYIQATTGLTV